MNQHSRTHDVGEESLERRMELLERRAQVIRSRLLRAVDALETRRHQVETMGKRASRLVVPVMIGAVGVAALFGLSAVAFGIALKRRARPLTARLASMVPWKRRVRAPSFPRRLFEKAALTAVTFVVTEIAKRASKNLVDGRLLDGRLAVGEALDGHHEAIAHPQKG